MIENVTHPNLRGKASSLFGPYLEGGGWCAAVGGMTEKNMVKGGMPEHALCNQRHVWAGGPELNVVPIYLSPVVLSPERSSLLRACTWTRGHSIS